MRIVRQGFERTESGPIDIILGAKTPTEAEQIIKAVRRRTWPRQTRFQLVAVDDGISADRVSAFYSDGRSIYETAAERLTAAGLNVSVQIESGDPKTTLLEAADAAQADAIFVVAGNTDNGRLDATVSGLVTSAKCTVEIVR